MPVGDAVADHAASAVDEVHPEPWDIVDLRRLRSVDPAVDALATAFGARVAEGWTLNVEGEDVCPVIRIPEGADLDGFLATLGKKERHEIRRKVRRAEAAGEVALVESQDPAADLDAFIDLHQRRWGDDGLFPATPGGDQSRVFIRRLFELFASGRGRPTLRLAIPASTSPSSRSAGVGSAPRCSSRRRARCSTTTPASTPTRATSPGVVLLERLVRRAIERGKCKVDLMRGDEPYKYEWGARDEPIQRILVRRA